MTPFTALDAWITAELQRLGEIVQDYDPCLELRWIPPENRKTIEDKSKAFCIWDTRTNYPVFFFSEVDTPVDVLAKLFEIDNKHGDVFSRMEAKNTAIRAMHLKEQMDSMEAAKDLAAFALKTEKSRWKHDGKTYDAELREDTDAQPKVIS